MIWSLICSLYAQPVEADETILPTIEYVKTTDGRDVYWLEDRRHRLVHIRVQFDSGVGDCASAIQQTWRHRYHSMNEKLLEMGGYARFWMGETASFVEISVLEKHEKEGLLWIRSFIKHTRIQDVKIGLSSAEQNLVMNVLYEREEPKVDKRKCSKKYHEWRSGHTPQFLFAGPMRMSKVLPMLDFFWSESSMVKTKHQFSVRKKRSVERYSIVNDDLGSQVELFVLVPLPKTSSSVLSMYQHILDGGFGGRLITKLREEKGWVYDVRTKMHYEDRIMLEISAQCNIEDVIFVRDEIGSILSSMNRILPQELERYHWSQTKKQREDIFLGMPYLVSAIQKTHGRVTVPKIDLVEDFATNVQVEDALWILRGREDLVKQIWPADWSLVSF